MSKKIAFITGASAGIGQGCAEAFAEAGYDLLLLARRKEKLDEIASLLKEKYNIKVHTIGGDVRNRPELVSALSVLPEEWKAVDVLINNAGLARGLSKIQDGDYNDWDEMIDTNVKGLLYISRIVLPWMVQRKRGHVINIASFAGREVYPSGNVYCGTKHAVKAISRGMAIDLNGTGVRVTNLDPGLVETEFSIVRFHGNKEAADKVYLGYKPLSGRDIGNTAVYCASVPEHVCIQDILVTPTAQASTMVLHREL